tara:strand:- start:171 stop:866 length:696 start_codon:yes stop_codon:yes gene_type:complete
VHKTIKMHSALKRTISFLAVLFIFITLIISPFLLTAFNKNFYEKEFNKLNVQENIERGKADLIRDEVLAYFKGESNLETGLLNDKEKQHLEDVKRLVNTTKYTIYILIIISLIILIIFISTKNYKTFLKTLTYASATTILTNITLFIISKFAFTKVFIAFHKLTFSNNLWILDPVKDNLIKTFPSQFFIDFTIRATIISLTISIILMALSCYGLFLINKGKIYKKQEPLQK